LLPAKGLYGGLLVLLLAVVLAGCGYRFTADSGTRLPSGQKVWVAYFQNTTVYPAASVALKRALFDQFSALRGIVPAATPAEGDLLVEGTLTGYGAGNASYTATDIVKEYRLTVSAEITVRRKGDEKNAKPLWKGPVSAWQDYPVAATIELQRSNEDAALLAASRKLAQQVIWNLEQGY
jgi:outer membrane lipopolysaccharide assembly protein LptE/RlpB